MLKSPRKLSEVARDHADPRRSDRHIYIDYGIVEMMHVWEFSHSLSQANVNIVLGVLTENRNSSGPISRNSVLFNFVLGRNFSTAPGKQLPRNCFEEK